MNKREKLIELMNKNSLDGLIFAQSANFQYLLGTKDLYWQRVCMNNIGGSYSAINYPSHLLYIDKDGEFHIITPPKDAKYFTKHENVSIIFMEEIQDELEKMITSTRIGVGFDCFETIQSTIHEFNPDIECVMHEDILAEMRAIKSPEEIQILRENAKFTDDAFAYLLPQLKEGMTQYDVEKILMNYGILHGLENFSFPPTAGFCRKDEPTSQDLFAFDQKAVLKPDTAIAFDLGYLRNGYCSDWGRTIYFGKAPEFLKKGYHALQQGQINMVNKIVPNQTKISELYDFILEKVTELGYKDYLRFQDKGSVGHQIGIDCHEHPMLNYGVDGILRPGMVFCSEPKMWFHNAAYMRVEDMILVTETGAEFLSNFDRDLFEIL